MLSICSCSVMLKSIVVICLFSLLTCGKHVHALSKPMHISGITCRGYGYISRHVYRFFFILSFI